MKYLLHTDIGHDPDDAIALAYLIEHGFIPSAVSISPGYNIQNIIVTSILKEYGIKDVPVIHSKLTIDNNYHPGKHKKFLLDNKSSKKEFALASKLEYDRALIIGPAKNIGSLKCEDFTFQGGYSPNSINQLEKFKDIKEVQSFNPCGAKTEFNMLLESDTKQKRYVGKNICHGFLKSTIKETWEPSNKIMKDFWDSLSDKKAMHDVLAAMMFMDSGLGIWESAKPFWVKNKLTTISTDENIFSLIGLR